MKALPRMPSEFTVIAKRIFWCAAAWFAATSIEALAECRCCRRRRVRNRIR